MSLGVVNKKDLFSNRNERSFKPNLNLNHFSFGHGFPDYVS